jgi:hypothetical protein
MKIIKLPEVWIVESFECGFCDVYNNPEAAQEHVYEMNQECPNDHYWFYPKTLKE